MTDIDASSASDDIPLRALALPMLAGAIALTIVFASADAMRRRLAGMPSAWGTAFTINVLDWSVWALLVPCIFVVGRRIRLDAPTGRAARLAGWVVLALASAAVHSAITAIFIRDIPDAVRLPGMGTSPSFLAFLPMWIIGTATFNLLIFVGVAGAIHAALNLHDARARERREAAMAARLARTELTVLRMQLQPHFFFNALHTVSSLMVTDVNAAQRVIAALGDLVRVSIDHTASQEVSLRDELAFVGRYLEIQTARFRRRLTVEMDVAPDALDALVPSLVLQPLVENAIRHGIEPFAAGGRIWIRAARAGDTVRLVVEDDGSGAAPTAPNGRAGGIGLANIEARLAHLYGSAHSFRAARERSGHFEVTLTLPYRVSVTSDGAAA